MSLSQKPSSRAATLHWETVGGGAPVLLIGGLGMDASAWSRTIAVLSRRLRVITFDNRGFGGSGPSPLFCTTDAMADDAAAVMDASGVSRAHVYGFSLGGMVAQRLTVRHADRVQGLVLGATHAGGPSFQRSDPATAPLLGWDLLLQAQESLWRSPLTLQGYGAQLGAALMHDSHHDLSRIRAPTLVVHGADDPVVPVANAEALARGIRGARLHVVPEAGHFYATDAPEVDELIADFLVGVA